MRTFVTAIAAIATLAGCGQSISYTAEAHQLAQINGRDTFAFHSEAIHVPDGIETHGENTIRFMEAAITHGFESRGLTRVDSADAAELVVDFSVDEVVHHDRLYPRVSEVIDVELEEGTILVVVHRADNMEVLWTGTAATQMARHEISEEIVHSAVDNLLAQYPHEAATDGSTPETAGGEEPIEDVPVEGEGTESAEGEGADEAPAEGGDEVPVE